MRYRDTKEPTTILLPLEISEGGVGSTEESTEIRERWNSPRINTYRYCVVNLSLFIMGMNDACIGVSAHFFLFCPKIRRGRLR